MTTTIDTNKAASLSQIFKSYNQKEGKYLPVKLSPSQEEIFLAIVGRTYPRWHVMTTTQYGKSFTVALAVLLRAATYPEKWIIVAPTEPKAMIIMAVILDHLADSPIISSQIEIKNKSEKVRHEHSKRRITFKRGGEIMVLSCDARNKKMAGETLMGFGGANVILDESSLIPDDIYAKVKRMLGGHADNFILEIGNPFHRNHFLKSFHNPLYRKIIVDHKRAVAEGRLQPQFVEEMRGEADFGVLYECQFPSEDTIDKYGFTALFLEPDILSAFRDEKVEHFGKLRLGVDVSGKGKNFTSWVLRSDNHAELLAKSSSVTLPETVGRTIDFMTKYDLDEEDIFLDASSGGIGFVELLEEKGISVRGISFAESAYDKEMFQNKRAEMYFRVQRWLKQGGTLERRDDFFELLDVRYHVKDSNAKYCLMSKDVMRTRGIPSPDVADALALTFADDAVSSPFVRSSVIARKREAKARRMNRTSFE